MIQTEDIEILERKVLRHFAIKAGRNPGYFAAATIEGLTRATWCDDEGLIKSLVASLVVKGKIIPASRILDGQKVYGFTCLPAKFREPRSQQILGELKLTPYDREFLRSCGIDSSVTDSANQSSDRPRWKLSKRRVAFTRGCNKNTHLF
jgi:hypothetical protein